ncbi:MAG: AVAST type 2 anti-phage system protein Avs2 [Bryobacteraceae bacterium]
MPSGSLNWQDLRPFGGSQNHAFEEVCAQIAAAEPMDTGAVFVRKAAPDAGVECYLRLASGDERAWQAKFFLSMGDAQWRELDESVRKAVEKHPRLVEYIVCVPLDRADPRLDDKAFAMDHWRSHVTKWEGWACESGMRVTFTYWGEHELVNRLLRDEHRGRLLYWFGKQFFSREWFDHQLEEAIANADQRYLPEINVDLAIQNVFDGLGRTSEFFDRFKVMQGKVHRAYRRLSRGSLDSVSSAAALNLEQGMVACLGALSQSPTDMQPVPLTGIHDSALTLAHSAQEMWRLVWEAAEARKKTAEAPGPHNRSLDYEGHFLGELSTEAEALANFCQTQQALLANTPALLLVGGAGTGKTHLLCHVARLRAGLDRPTILVLSEQLANAEPWGEIMRVLQLQCDADEFLGALNAAGQARGSRVLIAIDALNEGEGQPMWERSLAGFLTKTARYPWIGVAVSLRKSYEETMISAGLVGTKLLRVEHRGFQGAEARAAARFFAYYGIVAPTIPPLHPEFSNPLFLRLFCQALQNMGCRQLPPGLRGLTAVFKFFLDSVNTKLARPEFLNVDPADRIVHGSVQRLAEAMSVAQQEWLPRGQARALVDSCHQSTGYANSLFRHLVLEGVLAEDRFRARGEWTDGVRFTYQKFSDHLITQHLLRAHLHRADPISSFAPGTPLEVLVRDERACWTHEGIIEALAVQLPELVGRELPDLIPHAAGFTAVREAMVESIIWRAPESFTIATLQYLNQWLLGFRGTFGLAMSALLTTATQVDHPYNAHLLHRNLIRRPLPERDAWWSTYLHHEFVERDTNVITRLLDWCAIDEGKRDLSDESVLLAAITVTWFFTCSNRFLRDQATKALVRLVAPRLGVLATLIGKFACVDDPYVLERLMAAAYGCVMRSGDIDGIHAVARASYTAFFADQPPVHILLRDYARGVIERALCLRPEPAFQRARITPPYGSDWPERIPTEEELKTAEYNAEGAHRAQRRIWFSVMGDDFARYVIGTNSGSFEWANLPLRGTPPPSPGEQTRRFVASLAPDQRGAWRRFRRVHREERRKHLRLLPELLLWHFRSARSTGGAKAPGGVPRQGRRAAAQTALLAVLTREQRRFFAKWVVPFLDHGDQRFRDEHRFDLRLLQGYILPRVFALGWTAERFGEFDCELRDRGREAHKAERIGKKYQWVAYHEVLARAADQFVFKEQSWAERPVIYAGPWQVGGLRDIDPSIILRETARESRRCHSLCWWAPPAYKDFYAFRGDGAWLQAEQDLPSLAPWACVTDPADGSRWLALEAYYSWEEPTPPEREWSEMSHRTLWYQVRAYIVYKRDAAELFSWAQQQNFFGRWMPESRDFTGIFLGELYWSPAYREGFADLRGERAWTRGSRPESPPKSVVVPTMEYGGMGTDYDCSTETPIHICVPTPWLAEHLGLRWAGKEGEFCGPDGKVVARDPSVATPGPRALLVNESALRLLLAAAGCEIVWTVLGAKQIIGERPPGPGELQLNGAFLYRDGNVEGAVKGTYVAYPTRNEG